LIAKVVAALMDISDGSRRVRLMINVGAATVGSVDVQKQCSKTA
jgi:hypothetical protein